MGGGDGKVERLHGLCGEHGDGGEWRAAEREEEWWWSEKRREMRAIVDQGWIRLRTERSDGAVPLVMRRASFGLHLRSLGPVPFLPTPRHAGLHHPPSAPRVRRPGRDSFRLFPLPSLSLSVPASPGTRHAPTERRRHRIWPCHLAEPSASVAATVTLVLSVLLTPLEPTWSSYPSSAPV